MGSIQIYVGNYGSGKTELSLNTALRLRGEGKAVTLVDLDIVNPYFRSSEQAEMLDNRGIRLIAPSFAGTAVDIPVLPAEVTSVFQSSDEIIFDVGGDEVGAKALGRYYPYLSAAEKTVTMVINVRRPFSASAEGLYRLQQAIESQARIKVDAYVNNSNLGSQSSLEDLLEGERVIDQLSRLSGITKRLIAGAESILAQLPDGQTEKIPLTFYTRPDWLE